MINLLKNKNLQSLILIASFVLILEILGVFNIHLPQVIEIPIFVIIIFTIGRKVLLGGLRSLAHLNFADMNLLMTIAIIGAILIGEFEEAAVIVALFAVSEKLEDLGIESSQSAIDSLVSSTPKIITLKNGETKKISDVKTGDIFIVKPGDTVGLDGKVINGFSSVDESTITGEPLPIEKTIGSNIFASSKNQNGYLEIEVTKIAEDSVVQKIAELTSKALENKANYQKFIEKFSRYYTPLVFVLSILLVLVPTLMGAPFIVWFERGITLLLIACPCALVISTPISIFSAVGNASAKGILIKGGRFLEELGDVKAIAFDKTRTLTYGKPHIKDVIPCNHTSVEEILACAAGIANHSEHPLSNAIVQFAKDRKLHLHAIKDFKAITGKGISADCLVCKVGTHFIGNLEYIIAEGTKVPDQVVHKIEQIQNEGDTPVILADKNGIKGIFVIADQIREESQGLVNSLKQMRIVSIMLTGDNSKTASTVAKELSIDEFYGDLLPEGKVLKLTEIRNKYKSIAMVGDGVNGAPALALANVGVAMGAAGSDVAIESANIALMNDNIELIPYVIKLGKYTKKTIQTSILFAISTKLIALVLASFGIIGLGFAIFADVGVTMIVILLSLNLMNYKEN